MLPHTSNVDNKRKMEKSLCSFNRLVGIEHRNRVDNVEIYSSDPFGGIP